MAAVGFQTRHVAPIIVGAKPFTLRKPRKDKRDPKVGDALHLFQDWRKPTMAKFATARCALRLTLEFDGKGLRKVHHRGLDRAAPPIFVSVGTAILEAAELVGPECEAALQRLAQWDGFDSWADLYAWHAAQGNVGGVCTRELIGMAGVTPVEGSTMALLTGGSAAE